MMNNDLVLIIETENYIEVRGAVVSKVYYKDHYNALNVLLEDREAIVYYFGNKVLYRTSLPYEYVNESLENNN